MERREFIGLLSVGTGGLLAGCSGDSAESTPTEGNPTDPSTRGSDGQMLATTESRTTTTVETTAEQTPETTTAAPERPPNELVPDDQKAGETFGNAVAIDGETAVVGAIDGISPSGEETGAAYAFRTEDGEWVREAELVPEPRLKHAQFGRAVALEGDTALVSAYTAGDLSDRDGGDVHVFMRTDGTWSHEAILTREDGRDMDLFGSDVALDGDTAVVGAPSAGEYDDGGAYVFTRSNGSWSRQGALEPAGAKFGKAVAIDGDKLVVTAPGGLNSPSAAYVFERSSGSWNRSGRLALSDEEDAPERFGYSVSVSGSTVVVGAPEETVNEETRAGAAHVFVHEGEGWSQQGRLVSSEPYPTAALGASVTVTREMAVVGAPVYFENGRVFVFDRTDDSWTQSAAYKHDMGRRPGLGAAVDTDGESIIGGIPGADTDAGENAGAAYVFEN